MRTPTRSALAQYLTLAATLLVTGCADVSPTQVDREIKSRKYIQDQLDSPIRQDEVYTGDGVSESESYAISSPYESAQPLAPFGVYDQDFFSNPEIVTDAQFVAEGDVSMTDDQVGPIQTDQSNVESYTSTCSTYPTGGVDNGTQTLAYYSSGYCERQYNSCVARCRRIWSPRGRAICYAACMASYAACLRRR